MIIFRKIKMNLSEILVSIVLLVLLILLNAYNFLLFHVVVELVSVVIMIAFFMIVWNSRDFLQNHYFLFLGIAFAFVGAMDLVHTLSYKGMNIIEGYDANLPTQLWIGARYLQSISLLISPLFVKKKVKGETILWGYLIIFVALISLTFGRMFPDCYIEGNGLTQFKIFSEYIISFILFGSMIFLYRKRDRFDLFVLRLILLSIFLTIISEVAFTFYISVYGISNIIGHFLKIIAVYLIYKAVIEMGLRQPYFLLFKEIQESKERLEESNRIFKTVLDISDTITFKLDSLLRVTNVDNIYPDVDKNEVVGKTVTEILPDKPAEEFVELFHQAIQKREIIREVISLDRRGEEFWFDLIVDPIYDDQDNPEGIIGALTDITRRKNAREAIKEYKNFLEHVINSLSHPFMVIDADNYEIKLCNKAVSEKDIQDKSVKCYEISHNRNAPCSGKDHPCPIQAIKQTGEAAEVEHIHHHNKEKRYVEVHGYPIFNADGEVTQIIEYSMDITQRKLAEQSLKKSERKYRTLVESINEGIATVDENENFIYVNKATTTILGYSEDELLGKNLSDLTTPEEFEKILKETEKRKKGISNQYEITLMNKKGNERILLVSPTPVIDDDGNYKGAFSIFLDITKRKKAEQQLIESEKKLRELNATKDRFFSIISHDLKSPLLSLISGSKLLKKRVDQNDRDKIKHISASMLESSQNVYKLLEDLLSWSRIQRGKLDFNPKNIDLYYVVEQNFNVFRQRARQKGIELENSVSKETTIFADYDMTLTVVRNLINNALKFTDSGGKISVYSEANQVYEEIVIKDTGVGIKKDKIPLLLRIDSKYKKTGTSGEKGTGLGLILCKELIEKNNGRIWIESEYGKGTEVYFTLPKKNIEQTNEQSEIE